MTIAGRRSEGRRRRRAAALAAATTGLAIAIGLISVPSHRSPAAVAKSHRQRHLIDATLTARLRRSIRSVPRSFFGLSTEYWTLPIYEQHRHLFERILSL